jgi:hypothetical protein
MGDAGNGCGGITADPGQGAQGVGGVRNLAAKFGDHLPGGLVQEAGAAVVAQAAPQGQHRFQGSRGQGRDGGERRQKPAVVLEHGRDAGLLQHDLGDPDPVGIVVLPPGQVAPVQGVPGQQRPAECTMQRHGLEVVRCMRRFCHR